MVPFGSAAFLKEIQNCALPYRGNTQPIQELLTALQRSPLKCRTVIFEPEYVDKDYQDEHSAFYSRSFKKYGPRATRLHFFSTKFTDKEIQTLVTAIPSDTYLGFLVLRPTDFQRVGRTILRPTLKDPDREFVHCLAAYESHILGQKFTVKAMPFIQQDTQVGACAQASLWMVARYVSRRYGYREYLPSEINQFAKAHDGGGRKLPAERGLTWKQMLDAMEGMGLYALSYSINQIDDCSTHIDAAFPEHRSLTAEKKTKHRAFVRSVKLADIAYRYIESGLPVIFGTHNHALVGIGHTYNHIRSAKVAIQRIPAFITHNDASRPYGTMPMVASTKSELPFSEVEDIIAIVPVEVTLSGEAAELMARTVVERFIRLKTHDSDVPTYGDLIRRLRPEFRKWLNKLEYRTFLMPSVDFQEKIRRDIQGRGFNAIVGKELIELDYPKFVWVTEISTEVLLDFAKRQDRTCLGRVIIDSTAPTHTNGEMAVHFCDFLGLFDRQTGKGLRWSHFMESTPFGHQIAL